MSTNYTPGSVTARVAAAVLDLDPSQRPTWTRASDGQLHVDGCLADGRQPLDWHAAANGEFVLELGPSDCVACMAQPDYNTAVRVEWYARRIQEATLCLAGVHSGRGMLTNPDLYRAGDHSLVDMLQNYAAAHTRLATHTQDSFDSAPNYLDERNDHETWVAMTGALPTSPTTEALLVILNTQALDLQRQWSELIATKPVTTAWLSCGMLHRDAVGALVVGDHHRGHESTGPSFERGLFSGLIVESRPVLVRNGYALHRIPTYGAPEAGRGLWRDVNYPVDSLHLLEQALDAYVTSRAGDTSPPFDDILRAVDAAHA